MPSSQLTPADIEDNIIAVCDAIEILSRLEAMQPLAEGPAGHQLAALIAISRATLASLDPRNRPSLAFYHPTDEDRNISQLSDVMFDAAERIAEVCNAESPPTWVAERAESRALLQGAVGGFLEIAEGASNSVTAWRAIKQAAEFVGTSHCCDRSEDWEALYARFTTAAFRLTSEWLRGTDRGEPRVADFLSLGYRFDDPEIWRESVSEFKDLNWLAAEALLSEDAKLQRGSWGRVCHLAEELEIEIDWTKVSAVTRRRILDTCEQAAAALSSAGSALFGDDDEAARMIAECLIEVAPAEFADPYEHGEWLDWLLDRFESTGGADEERRDSICEMFQRDGALPAFAADDDAGGEALAVLKARIAEVFDPACYWLPDSWRITEEPDED